MSRFLVVIDVPDDSGMEDDYPRPWTPGEVEETINSFAEGYGAMVVKGPVRSGEWMAAVVDALSELAKSEAA